MYFSKVAFAAASLLATTSFAQSLNPDSVPLSLRDTWCSNQLAACPLICTQETDGSAATYANDCDAVTLNYHCVCENGLAPNVSEYSQTVPYYMCTEANTQCSANCGLGNNACSAACVNDHPCGAQNPTRVNTTSTVTGTAAATGSGSSTGTAVFNGFGSSATESSSSGNSGSSSSSSSSGSSSAANRVVLDMGQVYGLGVVALSVFAGFTVLL